MRRGLSLLALLMLFSSIASARRKDTHRYPYDQVWSTLVRLIRVDYGFNIRDRDREMGYLLFDYRDHGRTYPASLELVRRNPSQPLAPTQVTLNIPALPSYVERMVLDRLRQKLRRDLGRPLEPIRTPASNEATATSDSASETASDEESSESDRDSP